MDVELLFFFAVFGVFFLPTESAASAKPFLTPDILNRLNSY